MAKGVTKQFQIPLPLRDCYELLLRSAEQAKLKIVEQDRMTNTLKWAKKSLGLTDYYIIAFLESISDKETRISVSEDAPWAVADPFGQSEKRVREIMALFMEQFGTMQKGQVNASFSHIQHIAGQEPPKKISTQIFVSYRRSDSADVAGRIYDKLIDRFGKENVFKDVDSIPLGVDFRQFLDRSVSNCNVFLAIIGNQWLSTKAPDGKRRIDDEKDFVRIEIESAIRRDIPVIPVLVQGAEVPLSEDLPKTIRLLAFRNGISVRSDPDFHTDMERLIRGIAKSQNF